MQISCMILEKKSNGLGADTQLQTGRYVNHITLSFTSKIMTKNTVSNK
jgi:hypothetical protein